MEVVSRPRGGGQVFGCIPLWLSNEDTFGIRIIASRSSSFLARR